jgi:hypothetical protein
MDGQVTAFFEERIVARGSREAVTRAVEEGYSDRLSDVRVFEDESGRVIDLDIWDAAASAPDNGSAAWARATEAWRDFAGGYLASPAMGLAFAAARRRFGGDQTAG